MDRQARKIVEELKGDENLQIALESALEWGVKLTAEKFLDTEGLEEKIEREWRSAVEQRVVWLIINAAMDGITRFGDEVCQT